MTHYYTYYSYEEWGRGYIGSRPGGCECLPEHDPYLGSFRDKSFRPTTKIILGVYSSAEECLQAEIELHAFFEVDINPHFANKAKQTSTKFTMTGESHYSYGKPRPIEVREKISKTLTGRIGHRCPQSVIDSNKKRAGIPLSEEHKEKVRRNRKGKGKGPKTESHKKAMSIAQSGKSKGKKWWNDGERERFSHEQPDGFARGRLPRGQTR